MSSGSVLKIGLSAGRYIVAICSRKVTARVAAIALLEKNPMVNSDSFSERIASTCVNWDKVSTLNTMVCQCA